MNNTDILSILVGSALILAGRKLFWLAVGLIGFFGGMYLTRLFLDPGTHMLLFIAIGVGVLSVFLAIAVQKIAVGMAGFIAGGYGMILILKHLGFHLGNGGWVLVLVAGIAGLIVAVRIIEWALIVLSALSGSYIVVTALGYEPSKGILIFLALCIIGFVIQGRGMRKAKSEGRSSGKQQNASP